MGVGHFAFDGALPIGALCHQCKRTILRAPEWFDRLMVRAAGAHSLPKEVAAGRAGLPDRSVVKRVRLCGWSPLVETGRGPVRPIPKS